MRRTMRDLLTLLPTLILLLSPSSAQKTEQATTEEALADAKPPGTIFNGQDVPPITALDGPSYDDTISVGYWCVPPMYISKLSAVD